MTAVSFGVHCPHCEKWIPMEEPALAEVVRLTAERDDLQEKCTEAFDDAVQREHRYQSLRTRLRGLEQQMNEAAVPPLTGARLSGGNGYRSASKHWANRLARLLTTPEEP